MTKVYKPMPVLPSLTDEYLRSDATNYGPAVVELLLTIPAEYRQAAEAEVSARTSYIDASQPLHRIVMTGDPSAARHDVLAEIRAQLGP